MSGRESEGGTVLVTGAAGFIGFHLCRTLLDEGRSVVGIDNLDPYYDISLKQDRLAEITPRPGFVFERMDLADAPLAADLFRRHGPRTVIHLAGQAGVRHSLVDPGAYGRANLVAFINVLEGCRHGRVGHLVYASSSSVYGNTAAMPFQTRNPADHPLSLYGATKRANELMAHSYSSLFGLPTTGLRFFTVYGPWGRPDMAVYLFARAIRDGRPIQLFNEGRMSRDFTYVDDIVAGVIGAADRPPAPDTDLVPSPARGRTPFRVLNIGSDSPVELGRLVALMEQELGRSAIIERRPMQPGDAPASWADIEDLVALTGVRPSVTIEEGIRRFVDWFRRYEPG